MKDKPRKAIQKGTELSFISEQEAITNYVVEEVYVGIASHGSYETFVDLNDGEEIDPMPVFAVLELIKCGIMFFPERPDIAKVLRRNRGIKPH